MAHKLVSADNENRMEVPLNGKQWDTIWSHRPTPLPITQEDRNGKTQAGKTALQQHYNSQDMEPTKKSINTQMDKEELVRVQMEN